MFCLATYGEGDPTDNAMEFVDWLKNGDADLAGLNYAVCSVSCLTGMYHICLENLIISINFFLVFLL